MLRCGAEAGKRQIVLGFFVQRWPYFLLQRFEKIVDMAQRRLQVTGHRIQMRFRSDYCKKGKGCQLQASTSFISLTVIRILKDVFSVNFNQQLHENAKYWILVKNIFFISIFVIRVSPPIGPLTRAEDFTH